MKKMILSLFLCLASTLVADEAKEVAVEELKIDPLISMKEQFSKARKKGWDFSAERKKSELPQKSKGIEFEFVAGTQNYHPMQKSEEMMKSFRSDISEAERGKQLNRLSEMEQTYKPPTRR
jgi:hypothetical protein